MKEELKLAKKRLSLQAIYEFIYAKRSYIPIPFLLLLLWFAHPQLRGLVIGILVTILGELLRMWAVAYIPANREGVIKAESLATGGPYAYCRNPLYLGNFFIGLGYCIMGGVLLLLILYPLLFIWEYGGIARLEEEYLKEKFKKDYLSYLTSVPSWLPKLSPYPLRSPRCKRLGKIIEWERSTLAGIILITALMVVKMLFFKI